MYESYFRLREPPFNVTADPRFVYLSPAHQEALATLCYGVEQRKGTIVVTGEAGTGKTTLIKRFVQNAGPRCHISCIVDPRLTFGELLRCALNAFGATPSGRDRLTMLRQLRAYLSEKLAGDHVVALVLDEAQDIDDAVLDEIRLLADLERTGQALLQLVLIGQPELESRLDQAPLQHLRQRIALRVRLGPLDPDENRPYIDYRLAAAGYRGKAIFQSAAVRRIFYFSRGNPRLINVICDNSLLVACATSQVEIGAETVDEIAEDLQLGIAPTEPPTPFAFGCGPKFVAARGSVEEEDRREERDFDRNRFVVAERDANIEEPSAVNAEVHAAPRSAPAFFTERLGRRPLRQAAWLAALALIIGGAGLLMTREENTGPWAPATESMGKIQKNLAPLPERIYRVLAVHAQWENPFKNFAVAERQAAPGQSDETIGTNFAERPLPGAAHRQPAKADQPAKGSDRSETTAGLETKQPAARERPAAERGVPPLSPARYLVAENSFVRDRPTDEAKVIATLPPGTRIEVIERTGKYMQVESLSGEAIRGYVHNEDAFFKPIQ